jgi:hypothetical protein
MNKYLIPAMLLLAATVPLFGDSFNITVNITSTTDATTIPTCIYHGSFVTNGTCTLCTVASGGITSFDVPIQTGSSVTVPTVLVFDALDATNLGGALPQYDTTTQGLSSTSNPTIVMLEQITSGTNPFVGYPFLVLMEMTPTTLNTMSTTCDSLDTIRIGCVSIRPVEGTLAQGTYTISPQPSAAGCPATLGFWKHHPFPNSVQQSGLTIGGVPYSAANLLTILDSKGGNAVVILGRQLVGALLNLAAGGVHNNSADAAITLAGTLLQANNLNLLTSVVAPSSQLGQALLIPEVVLDGYNSANFNTCSEGSGLVTGSR